MPNWQSKAEEWATDQVAGPAWTSAWVAPPATLLVPHSSLRACIVPCVCACPAGKLPGNGEAGSEAGAGAIARAGGGVASGAIRMLDMFGCAINYNRRG